MRLILLATAAFLATSPAAAQLSRPAAPIARQAQVPARDVPYPGVMALEVDASDTRRGIFRVRQTVPVANPGRLTLRYPEWLPGNHSDTGPIEAISNLTFTAAGRVLPWRRNSEDVYSFDIDVPAGVQAVEARFDYLSDQAGAINRREMTPDLLNLQWEKMSLYPAGHYVRQIRVRPTVVLPPGFTGVSAVDGQPRTGRVDYGELDYETLVDSPMFAGRHFRAWNLGHDVDLNVFADQPGDLAATPQMIAAHRKLVDESLALFGGPRFDRYDFLLALSEELSGIGLEHHRSSENAVGRKYFTGWENRGDDHTLLPHEFVHSWNGKHRRPADLWTPDYKTEMQNSLLWLYEGQTSYWHFILGARSGLITPELALGEVAMSAAYAQAQAGRLWRSLEDTTNQPILGYRRPLSYASQQRSSDYYREGALVWLEADMLIREATRGRRSLDDFARIFFAGRNGDYGVRTYTFEDVVAALNQVHPHDWTAFFRERVQQPGAEAPLAGIRRGGYRLVFREEPNAYEKAGGGGTLNLAYSLGMSVAGEGRVASVMWDSPAFAEAIRPGATLVAVNGREYSHDAMRAALAAGKTGTPIGLIVRDGGNVREVSFDYRGGMRYPHLERVGAAPTALDRALQPRTR